MKFYLAPLEGLTGYIYRNAYEQHFGGVDKYFTPFIAANQHGRWSGREKQDVAPENNAGKNVVPQILTNNSTDFIRTTKQLQALGYEEVNLNLGCPSGTVVSKGKGAGFLGRQEALQIFLDTIFEAPVVKISIKTRLGIESPTEFEQILPIFNQYPLEELIIHPRVRNEFYRNTPHLDTFEQALQTSKAPVCYNGDLFNVANYEAVSNRFKEVPAMMFGRGILGNPGLILEIKHQKKLEQKQFQAFHETLYEEYQKVLSGDRNILFKMKEMWFYMGTAFEESDKSLKHIKKSQKLADYEQAVKHLFENGQLSENIGFYIPK